MNFLTLRIFGDFKEEKKAMDHLPGKMHPYTEVCILFQWLTEFMFPQELIYEPMDLGLRKITKTI